MNNYIKEERKSVVVGGGDGGEGEEVKVNEPVFFHETMKEENAAPKLDGCILRPSFSPFFAWRL